MRWWWAPSVLQGVDREVYTSAQTPHIGWWSVYLQWGLFFGKKIRNRLILKGTLVERKFFGINSSCVARLALICHTISPICIYIIYNVYETSKRIRALIPGPSNIQRNQWSFYRFSLVSKTQHSEDDGITERRFPSGSRAWRRDICSLASLQPLAEQHLDVWVYLRKMCVSQVQEVSFY